MKGRQGKKAPPADLLVCFPSRSNLSLMPNKPICSPGHPTDHTKRHPRTHHHHLNNFRSGQASPLFWAKTNHTMKSEIVNEPSSPKVTCAGQIKIKPNTRNHKNKIQPTTNLLQFLTNLRRTRLNLHCFGSPQSESDVSISSITPSVDIVVEEDHRKEEKTHELGSSTCSSSSRRRRVFPKWFMILQESKKHDHEKERQNGNGFNTDHDQFVGTRSVPPSPPPSNALLLMRCKSLPIKNRLQEQEFQGKEKKVKLVLEQENTKKKKKKKKERVILKCHASDFPKISSHINYQKKETWAVGGLRSDPFSMSQSWNT